ncbi:MAG: hypothetical protein EYC70_16540 [Planctomycetota bacterium]|nr:MAG: hypothetical protein EYC70_16540 [Planctomycetota bacterium]
MSPRSRVILPALAAGLLAGVSWQPLRAAVAPPAGAALAAQAGGAPSAQHKFDLGITPEAARRTGPDGISFEEAVKRALIYSAGANHVQHVTIQLMLQHELDRRKAEGEPLQQVEIADGAVELALQQKMEEVGSQENPSGLGFWEQLDLLGFTPETYREDVLRTNLLLDGMFFPEDPDQWPEDLLKRIFEAGSENSYWDTQMVELRESMRQAKAEGKDYPVDEFMRTLIMRGPVLRWLTKNVPSREPFMGLPEGVALRVGSVSVPTDELLAKCWTVVGPVDKRNAVAWVETLWKTQEALRKRGVLMSPQEAADLMVAEAKEYEGSIISYEQVALQFLGFPTMEAYRSWHRLRQSFRKSLPDPYPADLLQEHLALRGSFLAGARVDAEVILISARDPRTGLFPRTGDPFGAAAARAEEAKAKLAGGAEWSAVLAEYSDYPEAYPGAAQGMPQPHRGRLGPLELNPLREFLGETEYQDFVTGVNLADQIFFEAEKGAVYGPVRGAIGYFFFRVNDRLPATREIFLEPVEGQSTEDDVNRHRFLVGDDYLSLHFREFVNQAAAQK